MIKQITIDNQEINWDTEKDFHNQEATTQQVIRDHLNANTPTSIVPDLVWGDQRKGREIYDIDGGIHEIRVTPMYVYNNRPRTAKYKDIIEIIKK